MTDHLPECIYAPRNVDPKKGIEWGGQPCICPALRACEQRVLSQYVDGIELVSYRKGLTAAREAVNMWISYTFPNHNPCWTKQIPAAIDALRGER